MTSADAGEVPSLPWHGRGQGFDSPQLHGPKSLVAPGSCSKGTPGGGRPVPLTAPAAELVAGEVLVLTLSAEPTRPRHSSSSFAPACSLTHRATGAKPTGDSRDAHGRSHRAASSGHFAGRPRRLGPADPDATLPTWCQPSHRAELAPLPPRRHPAAVHAAPAADRAASARAYGLALARVRPGPRWRPSARPVRSFPSGSAPGGSATSRRAAGRSRPRRLG